MANRDMQLQVIVKLRDEMSRGLDGALRKITAFGNRAKAVFAGIGAGISALSQKIGALGIGAGIGLEKGLDSFVRMDAGIRDVGITLGKSGKELERFIKSGIKDLEKLALVSGQTSQTLTGMWNVFAQAGGLSEEDQKALLVPTSKATTAANADPKDMAKIVVALYKNAGLKTQPEIELALAHLIQAGKLGNVELKDFAGDLPTILASQANLGLTGMRAVDTAGANIEIAKNTTGTPGEAATNYRDFLAGLNAAHTRKRFEDHGVDLPGVLADAAAKNINPVDAVLQKISKIINQPKVVADAIKRAKGKGLDDKRTLEETTKAVEAAVNAAGLGELFVNQQTLTYLIARQLGKTEYKEMLKTLAETDTGITDTDHASRMAGPEAKQRVAGEKIEQIGRRMGESISGIFDKVGWVAEKLQGMIAALDQISPKIVDTAAQLGSLVGAITGAVFALRMLGFGGGAAVAGGAVAGGAAAAAAGGAGTAGAAGSGLLSLVGRYGAKGLGLLTRGATGILGALAFVSEALQAGIPTTKEGMQYRLDAGPIDFATYERAWREEKEWRRDPEAARGRAMMRKGGITLPDPIRRDPEHEPWLKIGKPDLSFEAITGNKKPDLQYMIGAAFAGFLKATGMAKAADKPAPPPPPQKVDVQANVTVKVEGPGTVVSTSTKTTGGATAADRGPTVGRP